MQTEISTPGDQDRHPRTLGELEDHTTATRMPAQSTKESPWTKIGSKPPALRRDAAPTKAAHAKLREGESDEHVDGIHRHQHVDGAMRVEQARDGRAADHEHAVVAGEAVRERAEPAGHPAVERHVGHDARAADVAGLRGKEQQAGLGAEGQDAEPRPEIELFHEQAVHGAALDGLEAGDQITDHQAAGGDGQGEGHVKHRPLSRW